MIERKLMLVERIMYVDPETPLNCIFTAKIQGKIAEEHIRNALVKIQRKHPLLRSVIEIIDAKQPHFVVKECMESIPLHVIQRQTDMDWLTASEREWYRPFKADNKPLAQLVWIKGEDVSELLWVLPHCICDGTSIVTLMRELLSLLDDPNQELQPYPLFKSVNDFLLQGFEPQKKSRKAKRYLLLARLFFFLQRKSRKRNSGKNYAIHWKLDTETTVALTKVCKMQGISVHAVLCTAFMQAFREVRGKLAKNKVISPVDIRHFIPEIKQDHMFAFAPTVELSLKKRKENILANANAIKSELAQKMEKVNAQELLWMGEQMHPLVERMITMLKSSPGGHDITLSNMGKIQMPSAYKNFTLETLYSPTVAFPWLNSNTLVTTTFNQQMDFTFMSNEDFLPKEEAIKIKDKVIGFLALSL
ncbi:condensation domain-containing protein [Sphingobacterium sp. NGMCC 1.201703]|uniref:condensation domain-containing protein n=1 Tax=Sphingobacterium sp. NGMCC 1.201703 TaxID=3388657 RepID=UPI0039FC2D2D